MPLQPASLRSGPRSWAFAGRIAQSAGHQAIWVVVLVVALVMGAMNPIFFSLDNLLLNVLRHSAVIGIMALGMTLVIASRGLDLSVGSNVALSSSLMGLFIMERGASVGSGILIALAVGALIGAVNGLLISVVGVPPFIATLGMLSIARGLALVLVGRTPTDIMPEAILFLGRGIVAGIPVPVVLLLLTWAGCAYLVRSTKFGHYALAIGSNEEAVRLSGVRVRLYKFGLYVFLGVLIAAAGIVLTGRLGAAQATTGGGFEFAVIAAVVVGGTSLFGGQANLAGSVGGAVLVAVLNNGLLLHGIDTNAINITIGLVMIGAVAYDGFRRSRATGGQAAVQRELQLEPVPMQLDKTRPGTTLRRDT